MKNKAMIKFIHYAMMFLTVFLWFVLILQLIDYLGVDNNIPASDLPASIQIILFSSMIITFILFVLAGNLISYFVLARVLYVPRHKLEKIIEERMQKDPRERLFVLQKFYLWCLDIAYKYEKIE